MHHSIRLDSTRSGRRTNSVAHTSCTCHPTPHATPQLSLSAPKLTVSAGARVYINGALAASDPSGGKAGGGSGRITKDLKKRALVAGLNVIAVQVRAVRSWTATMDLWAASAGAGVSPASS
jgi:hypothetical protein